MYIIEKNGLIYTIKFFDSLTVTVVADLQEALKEILDNSTIKIIFDFAELTMIDSSGIGFLIAINNRLEKMNKKMQIINVPSVIIRLLQNMHLVTRLNII